MIEYDVTKIDAYYQVMNQNSFAPKANKLIFYKYSQITDNELLPYHEAGHLFIYNSLAKENGRYIWYDGKPYTACPYYEDYELTFKHTIAGHIAELMHFFGDEKINLICALYKSIQASIDTFILQNDYSQAMYALRMIINDENYVRNIFERWAERREADDKYFFRVSV